MYFPLQFHTMSSYQNLADIASNNGKEDPNLSTGTVSPFFNECLVLSRVG